MTEQKPQDPAPHVSIEEVEANIASTFYFTAGDGVRGQSHMGTSPAGRALCLEQMTFCVLLLRNGFKVVGINEGPVDPANFDPEVGRRYARQKAIDKAWELMGYELKQRLHKTEELRRACMTPKH